MKKKKGEGEEKREGEGVVRLGNREEGEAKGGGKKGL